MKNFSTGSADHYEVEAGEIIGKIGSGKEQAIPLLQEVQRRYGYLPERLVEALCRVSGLPEAVLYGVATFYSQFRFKPRGKFALKVCVGTACHVAGAQGVVEALSDELKIEVNETTEDLTYSLESVACLGCCSLAPVMMINEETVGQLDPLQVKKVLKKHCEK